MIFGTILLNISILSDVGDVLKLDRAWWIRLTGTRSAADCQAYHFHVPPDLAKIQTIAEGIGENCRKRI